MPQAHISLHVPGENIRHRLGQAAKYLGHNIKFHHHSINLIAFPHCPSSVVNSDAIKRALHRLPRTSESILMIVGWDFTVEARVILGTLGAIVLSDRNHGWSDAQWFQVKHGSL